MKKNIRRVLSICLAVVLMLSMAVIASAASKTITFEGGRYIVNVTRGSRNNVNKAISASPIKAHTYGNLTGFYGGLSYNFTCSATPVTSPFASHILSLYGDANLLQSISISGTVPNTWYYTDRSDASGNYQLGISFTCFDAEWSVLLDMPSTIAPSYPDSWGTAYHAPTSEWKIKPVKVG